MQAQQKTARELLDENACLLRLLNIESKGGADLVLERAKNPQGLLGPDCLQVALRREASAAGSRFPNVACPHQSFQTSRAIPKACTVFYFEVTVCAANPEE